MHRHEPPPFRIANPDFHFERTHISPRYDKLAYAMPISWPGVPG